MKMIHAVQSQRCFSLAVVLLLLGGMKAGSSINLGDTGHDRFRTVAGRVTIAVNGAPAELAGLDVALANPAIKGYVWDLGNGSYNIAFSHVPRDLRHLEVTARVPSPSHSGQLVSQTLMVNISKDNVDIPVNISTN